VLPLLAARAIRAAGPARALGAFGAAAGGGALLPLAWTALKVGALSFGGGFVIIPLMQADATGHHWMTSAQFLNGVALGQVTPGPVLAGAAVLLLGQRRGVVLTLCAAGAAGLLIARPAARCRTNPAPWQAARLLTGVVFACWRETDEDCQACPRGRPPWCLRQQGGRTPGRRSARVQFSGVCCPGMTREDAWLAAVWEIVRGQLPAAPASVVEVGCGSSGGLVPVLREAGYEATGVDPAAPRGPWYCPVEFERYEIPEPASAIVACTSLHHVADLGEVTDRLAAALAPGGVLVVVEWARERFDEATARWCFDRLPSPGDDPGWLNRQCAQWRQSGQPWTAYLRSWAEAEGLHSGQEILRELDARFDFGPAGYGPYFFPDLAGITEADERAAIDQGQIRGNRIQYVGRKRRSQVVTG
jgi:SAM-dependent methyltransferase